MRVRISFAAFVGGVVICLALTGYAVAQESPQKGVAAGRLEMAQQIRASNNDPFEVKALEPLRHMRERPWMTPMQSTTLFLRLDRNHDKMLARSEIPDDMSILRSDFDRYDRNGDHRLTYSEFANYTDIMPHHLADTSP